MGKKTLTEAQIENIKIRSTTELKPCPFCGSKANILKFPRCNRKYVVICENNLCMASIGNYSMTKELAIMAWNKRVN